VAVAAAAALHNSGAALAPYYEFLQWSMIGQVSSLLATEQTRSEPMPLGTKWLRLTLCLPQSLVTSRPLRRLSLLHAGTASGETDSGPISYLPFLELRKSPN
jgi:hypothetical protein